MRSNGTYANVTQADIQEGIATDNTALLLGTVSANDFCIQGTNKSDTTLVFHYQKSVDDIFPGACA